LFQKLFIIFHLTVMRDQQVIMPPLVQRWTQFALLAASVSYDESQLTCRGGDMCSPMLKTFTHLFNSLGPQAFPPFFEAIVQPAVHRVMSAVASDGENEYFDGDWNSFMSNFVEFLEHVLQYPCPVTADVVLRHDVLSCVVRLLSVQPPPPTHSSRMFHTLFSNVPHTLLECSAHSSRMFC
jgi:hypothetical protein